jgi:hypothetical protein
VAAGAMAAAVVVMMMMMMMIGNHVVRELQKTAILGIAHILQKVLM